MIEPLLKSRLEPIARRHRQLRFWQQLTLAWGFIALGGLVVLLLHKLTGLNVSWAVPLLIIVAGTAALLVRRASEAWEPDWRQIARDIEQKHPELHALLLTAVEQQPDPATGKLNFLQERVVLEALAEAQSHTWLDAISPKRLLGAQAVQLVTLAMLLFVGAQLYLASPFSRAGRAAAEARKEGVTVSPGDASVERGSGFIVMAKFAGFVPSEATLVIQPQNQPAQKIPLVKNLEDPVFGGGLPEVDASLTYRIEYAGKATRDFKVSVFEHPRLDRADATLKYPDYTKLPEKQIPDTRRISAVEGTKLEVAFNLNKPVARAELVAKGKGEKISIPLTVATNRAAATLTNLTLAASQTYELRLVDADGRTNKVPAQFIVDVLPNRRPELKFDFPKGDQRVSALQEISFKADAWDDFGLTSYGLSYTVAGKDTKDIVFGRDTKPDEKRTIAHLLKLEELGVHEDELISWHLWAEDTGPDGKPRRTESDMFFAEVRPFESIYKQGTDGESEEKDSQKKGAGQKAQELAELQKQIITATWNIKRSEDANSSGKISAKYLKDEPVVRDGQDDALQQADELKAGLKDEKSKKFAEIATTEMKKALEQLEKATNAPAPLPAALSAEQAAYNALLKLAARQFSVTRSQKQSQQSKNGQQKNQRELDQLELKSTENRYEKQKQAKAMEDEQQQEQLNILNRLKELAQRQQDINERLKEMQTALQEAKTEKEKEEIRRQLKRLREEQQEMLANIDELKQKMEQSPNQSQMSEERKRLEQARSEAQRSAENLERNQATQALADATRAQRDLQELRDDYRKKTSQQFREEMRDMRNEARELSANQQEIAKELQAKPEEKAQRRTLDGSSKREQMTQQFERQQSTLTNLVQNMTRVSEAAETAEPLLAKELYDTLRKTSQANTEQALQMTQELTQRGYLPQARQFEEKARKDIEELKTGVERAAESVLGDEAEALRQARAEINALAEQVNRELMQRAPQLADAGTNQPGQQSRSGKMQPGQRAQQSSESNAQQNAQGPQPGEQAGSEMQKGQRGDQQSKAGEPKNGQGKQGEPKQASAQGGQKKGQQPGQQKGQNPQGNQPGQQPGKQPGETAQQGQQPGQQGQQGQGQQPGQQGQQPGQPGQQPGQQGQMAQGQQGQGGQRGGANAQRGGNNSPNSSQPRRAGEIPFGGEFNNNGGYGGGVWNEGPIQGEGFVQWADRLRNVEEMLDDPALRGEVARVREAARVMRMEYKRNVGETKWDLVNTKISKPLVELRDRLGEELARRDSKEALVPIDRDPVPQKFTDLVRKYYEELGKSQ
ncbi:MAG: hypothetical protein HY301_09910 [Verrucomicrobia bacterium]|nr:hypothetical protein [Verrucomicrobiota bacterium]